MVKKLIELVGLWWAEAGRYNVLPLDDRFQERSLAREALASTRGRSSRFYPGAVRIPEHVAPEHAEPLVGGRRARSRSPKAARADRSSSWAATPTAGRSTSTRASRRSVTTWPPSSYTYIRGDKPLAPGPHVVRYEFEKRGKEPFGAGGIGRIFVDGQKVAEGEIPRTAAFGYSLDETFDVGCDKGAPVTDEYPPLAVVHGHDRQGRHRSQARSRRRCGTPRDRADEDRVAAAVINAPAPRRRTARARRDRRAEPRSGCPGA